MDAVCSAIALESVKLKSEFQVSDTPEFLSLVEEDPALAPKPFVEGLQPAHDNRPLASDGVRVQKGRTGSQLSEKVSI